MDTEKTPVQMRAAGQKTTGGRTPRVCVFKGLMDSLAGLALLEAFSSSAVAAGGSERWAPRKLSNMKDKHGCSKVRSWGSIFPQSIFPPGLFS